MPVLSLWNRWLRIFTNQGIGTSAMEGLQQAASFSGGRCEADGLGQSQRQEEIARPAHNSSTSIEMMQNERSTDADRSTNRSESAASKKNTGTIWDDEEDEHSASLSCSNDQSSSSHEVDQGLHQAAENYSSLGFRPENNRQGSVVSLETHLALFVEAFWESLMTFACSSTSSGDENAEVDQATAFARCMEACELYFQHILEREVLVVQKVTGSGTDNIKDGASAADAWTGFVSIVIMTSRVLVGKLQPFGAAVPGETAGAPSSGAAQFPAAKSKTVNSSFANMVASIQSQLFTRTLVVLSRVVDANQSEISQEGKMKGGTKRTVIGRAEKCLVVPTAVVLSARIAAGLMRFMSGILRTGGAFSTGGSSSSPQQPALPLTAVLRAIHIEQTGTTTGGNTSLQPVRPAVTSESAQEQALPGVVAAEEQASTCTRSIFAAPPAVIFRSGHMICLPASAASPAASSARPCTAPAPNGILLKQQWQLLSAIVSFLWHSSSFFSEDLSRAKESVAQHRSGSKQKNNRDGPVPTTTFLHSLLSRGLLWVELLQSHNFLPFLLNYKDRKGWLPFCRLLVKWLRFLHAVSVQLENYVHNSNKGSGKRLNQAEVHTKRNEKASNCTTKTAEAAALEPSLRKTTELLLLLLHDYPDFLSEYYQLLLNALPYEIDKPKNSSTRTAQALQLMVRGEQNQNLQRSTYRHDCTTKGPATGDCFTQIRNIISFAHPAKFFTEPPSICSSPGRANTTSFPDPSTSSAAEIDRFLGACINLNTNREDCNNGGKRPQQGSSPLPTIRGPAAVEQAVLASEEFEKSFMLLKSTQSLKGQNPSSKSCSSYVEAYVTCVDCLQQRGGDKWDLVLQQEDLEEGDDKDDLQKLPGIRVRAGPSLKRGFKLSVFRGLDEVPTELQTAARAEIKAKIGKDANLGNVHSYLSTLVFYLGKNFEMSHSHVTGGRAASPDLVETDLQSGTAALSSFKSDTTVARIYQRTRSRRAFSLFLFLLFGEHDPRFSSSMTSARMSLEDKEAVSPSSARHDMKMLHPDPAVVLNLAVTHLRYPNAHTKSFLNLFFKLFEWCEDISSSVPVKGVEAGDEAQMVDNDAWRADAEGPDLRRHAGGSAAELVHQPSTTTRSTGARTSAAPAAEKVQAVLIEIFLQRLLAHRPHPWGLLVCFVRLVRETKKYRFWKNWKFLAENKDYTELEQLFKMLAAE
ncbi:unnamed protein product [Amoebophrya sp. A120]|nr:unnamed protein product [Amoebophrya sp. A120]|eukprot:GSA120T00022018001.1